MGRSRGGLTTKIHALVDAHGNPVALTLSAGQTHDSKAVEGLLATIKGNGVLLADRAYDSDPLRTLALAHGFWANIPSKSNRMKPHRFSKSLYQKRNLVERFFNKIKHYRAIATRYDKKPENFLAAVKLVATQIWLRHYESTA